MKITFYNTSLLSGGIEKCIELFSKDLGKDYEIEIVYTDDKKLDQNIVHVLSKNAYVHKLAPDEIINTDICIWCRLYFDWKTLTKQIVAKRNLLWVHSKPRVLPNCILDDNEFMKKIEKIICVSEAIKSEVGFEDKSIVIHNFVDKNIKKLADEIENPFLDTPSDYLKLLIVSRLSVGKGFERVEILVKNLINMNIKFVLKVIGVGRDVEAQIKSDFQKYEQVEFLGYKENPFPYMKNADFLLLLSDYESWGNVITESKVLGTPCIVTNFPSAKEQIENNSNGIVIPLECNDYTEYLEDLKSKSIKLKQTLESFNYINETNKWKELLG